MQRAKVKSAAASRPHSCSTWPHLDRTEHFNWQVAASSILPDGSRRRGVGWVGWVDDADVAALRIVFLAEACWCNRAITLFVIGEWQLGVPRGC